MSAGSAPTLSLLSSGNAVPQLSTGIYPFWPAPAVVPLTRTALSLALSSGCGSPLRSRFNERRPHDALPAKTLTACGADDLLTASSPGDEQAEADDELRLVLRCHAYADELV